MCVFSERAIKTFTLTVCPTSFFSQLATNFILRSIRPKPFYDQFVQQNLTASSSNTILRPRTLFYSQFVNTSILRVVCQR